MKAEYANPFIRAASEVFAHETHLQMTRKGLELRKTPLPSRPVCIILGITGPIRGQVVYALDEDFAHTVARRMLPGKLPAEVKRLTNSAISEIANMITGKASIELAGEDKTIELTPPAVFTGERFHMDFLNIPTLSLSLISEAGSLEINIALTEGSS
ncbi:MAG: chemotaxis protein CheX [Spirochaetales bacterium]|nr:chemotaxis protein CheX [Spirochaetales bacterium]